MMISVTQRTATAMIRFTATLDTIDASTIMRLPEEASRLLASRGQVAVRGLINGHEFRTVLEPDGVKGHWMKMTRHCGKPLTSAGATPSTSPCRRHQTGRSRTYHQNWPQLWRVRRSRSETSGTTSRRWRAGNGCAGSTRPQVPRPASGVSR